MSTKYNNPDYVFVLFIIGHKYQIQIQ